MNASPWLRHSVAAEILDDVHAAGGELVVRGADLYWVTLPRADVRASLERRIRTAYWDVVISLDPRCFSCRKRGVAIVGTACDSCRGRAPRVDLLGFGPGTTVEHALTDRGHWLCGVGVHRRGTAFFLTPPFLDVQGSRQRLCLRCARELELHAVTYPSGRQARLPGQRWP